MLVKYFLGSAKRQPLLLVLEDVHWADPSTLEWVRMLTDRITASALLLLITGRPESVPVLPRSLHLTQLSLGRLGRAAVAAMVASRVSDQQMAFPLLSHSGAGGVPLFVEGIAKWLNGVGVTTDGSPEVRPLRDTLMARLDRLPGLGGADRIGMLDWTSITGCLAIADLPEKQSRVPRSAARPSCSFTSTTSVEQAWLAQCGMRAAESTSQRRRRTSHARILTALRAGLRRRHPEELAQHAAAAGLWRKALQYYGQAGKAALDRSATIEGFALTAKAIKAGEHMAEIRKHGLLSSNSTRHAGGRISRSGTRLGSPPSSRPRRPSAAQFGLDRMSCQLGPSGLTLRRFMEEQPAMRSDTAVMRLGLLKGLRTGSLPRSRALFWVFRSCSGDSTVPRSLNS